jgi:hypothetical protein
MDSVTILWSAYGVLVAGELLAAIILRVRRSHRKTFRSLLLTCCVGFASPFIVRPLYTFLVPPPPPVPGDDFFHHLAMGIGWAVQAELNTLGICLLITLLAFSAGFLIVFKSEAR